MQAKRAKPILRGAVVTAALILAGVALPGTALGQGSAAAGPGLAPAVSEVLGIQVQGPQEAPATQAQAPAAQAVTALVAPAPPPAEAPVSEVLGIQVQPPAAPPAAAQSVVAPPPALEAVAGRSVASPPGGQVLALAPNRPSPEFATMGSRASAGLPTARVLPKAGDGPESAPGVWLPLVLAGGALVLAVLGLVWPPVRRRTTPHGR
jgi:hypothetical protein